MSHDLVIDDALVIDGTGAPGRVASVAITDDRITEVGDVTGSARRRIDAGGRLVTPGFVDIHTHFDAQIWWDPLATPSCWHGITSVVMGNCGVSFAPTRPADREYVVHLMESVEDIPAATMLAAMPFDWQTYGEYLASLDRRAKGLNVGGMVGHSAVRYHVMGERSLDKAPATDDDVAAMQAVVAEAIDAGALGFSTSRTMAHRVPDGRPIPGTYAAPAELLAIAEVLSARRRGVMEVVARLGEGDDDGLSITRAEIDWMGAIVRDLERPVTFALVQNRRQGDLWSRVLDFVAEAAAGGARLRPQTSARGVGGLYGLSNITPFDAAASWKALKPLSVAARLGVLADPAGRERLIREGDEAGPAVPPTDLYLLGPDHASYSFTPEVSLAGIAARGGETPAAAFVRLAMETDGRALFAFPVLNSDPAAVERMLADPNIVLGLGDAGAHVGKVMDASWSTSFLSQFVRDRRFFTLEDGVRRMTSEPAALFGLRDRGVIAPGAFADLNVIDLEALRAKVPEWVVDLPEGAGRYVQRADGYDATIVNGQVLVEGGEHTGVLPGVVLRSEPG